MALQGHPPSQHASSRLRTGGPDGRPYRSSRAHPHSAWPRLGPRREPAVHIVECNPSIVSAGHSPAMSAKDLARHSWSRTSDARRPMKVAVLLPLAALSQLEEDALSGAVLSGCHHRGLPPVADHHRPVGAARIVARAVVVVDIGDPVLEKDEHLGAVVDTEPVAGAEILVDPHQQPSGRSVACDPRYSHNSETSETRARVTPPLVRSGGCERPILTMQPLVLRRPPLPWPPRTCAHRPRNQPSTLAAIPRARAALPMVDDAMRVNPYAVRPKAYQALRAVIHEIHQGTLDPALRCLVEVRVSQMNGCGFCLAMHADTSRAAESRRQSSTPSPAGARTISSAIVRGSLSGWPRC